VLAAGADALAGAVDGSSIAAFLSIEDLRNFLADATFPCNSEASLLYFSICSVGSTMALYNATMEFSR
jgi:hypothetical protein